MIALFLFALYSGNKLDTKNLCISTVHSFSKWIELKHKKLGFEMYKRKLEAKLNW